MNINGQHVEESNPGQLSLQTKRVKFKMNKKVFVSNEEFSVLFKNHCFQNFSLLSNRAALQSFSSMLLIGKKSYFFLLLVGDVKFRKHK